MLMARALMLGPAVALEMEKLEASFVVSPMEGFSRVLTAWGKGVEVSGWTKVLIKEEYTAFAFETQWRF